MWIWMWMLDGARLATRLKHMSALSAFGLALHIDVSDAQVYMLSEYRRAKSEKRNPYHH